MSNNAINPQVPFTDTAGNPRANGLLYFYENKTTALAVIYSDEALSIPQANPYTLDAYGRIGGSDRQIKYTSTLTMKATNSDGSKAITYDDVVTSGSLNNAFADQYKTNPSDPQAMTVTISAGKVMNGETLVTNVAQTTTLITAPTTNPRIDRIVINRLTGIYSIITGSEAATPTAPAITSGNAPSAQVLLQTSSSTIAESMITDERISGAMEPSNANTAETLTNKTIGDTNTINAQDDAFTIDDAADATKQIDFNAAGTTGTKTTITSSQTANRTMTIPNATDTFVGRATTDTLTNKEITAPIITSPLVSGLTLSDGQMVVEGATADAFETTLLFTDPTADRTVTVPDATDTLVGKSTADVFTNKEFGDKVLIASSGDSIAPIADLHIHNSTSDSASLQMTNAAGSTATDGFSINIDAANNVLMKVHEANSSITVSAPNDTVLSGDKVWLDAGSNSGSRIYFGRDGVGRSYVDGSGRFVIAPESGFSGAAGYELVIMSGVGSSVGCRTQYLNLTTGTTGNDGFIVGLDNSSQASLYNQNNTDMVFGTNSLQEMYLDASARGLVVGAPTGAGKGVGTVNAQAVYDDNVLLTDYVFDLYIDGSIKKGDEKQSKRLMANIEMLKVDEFTSYWIKNKSLPTMPTRKEFDENRMGIGDLSQRLWETVELQAVHISQLSDEIKKIKNKLTTKT